MHYRKIQVEFMSPPFKFNEEITKGVFCNPVKNNRNLIAKIEFIFSKVTPWRERDDSGLFETCFSQVEFPESGEKMNSDFRGKFKKR